MWIQQRQSNFMDFSLKDIWDWTWQNLRNVHQAKTDQPGHLPWLFRVDQPGHLPRMFRVLSSVNLKVLGPELPTERLVKALIRLYGCPGWSQSSLGVQVLLLVLSGSYHRTVQESNLPKIVNNCQYGLCQLIHSWIYITKNTNKVECLISLL